MSTSPSQGASSVEHLGGIQDPNHSAIFIGVAAPAPLISGDFVLFHGGDVSMLHEYIDSGPEFMSRGVLPRGPAGELVFSIKVPVGCK